MNAAAFNSLWKDMSSLIVDGCYVVLNIGSCSTFKKIERYIC